LASGLGEEGGLHPTPLSSASDGEFHPFSLIGSSLAGGVGAPKRFMFLPGSVLEPSSLCLGVIGMDQNKFCIKMAAGCGALSHQLKKFSLDCQQSYVKENKERAWISPSINLVLLNSAQVMRLAEVQLTLVDWKALFEAIEGGSYPKWLEVGKPTFETPVAPSENTPISPAKEADLESPKHANQLSGLFLLIPTLSFNDSVTTEELKVRTDKCSLDELKQILLKFRQSFSQLKTKWALAFTEVETGYNFVVKDLSTLETNAQKVQAGVGSPVPVNGQLFQSVWGGVASISASLQSHFGSLRDAIQLTQGQISAIQDQQWHVTGSVLALEEEIATIKDKVEQKLQPIEKCLQIFEQRFGKILSILQSVTWSAPDGNIQAILMWLHHVESKLASSTTMAKGHNTSGDPQFSQIHLRDIQAQSQQLRMHFIGNGVQIGSKVFQSFCLGGYRNFREAIWAVC